MKKYIVLIVETLFIVGVLLMSHFVNITGYWKLLWFPFVNILTATSAFVSIKLTDIKIDFEWKNYKQYLIGIGIAVVLGFSLGVVPALCGTNFFVGPHANFTYLDFFYELAFLILIIGPTEEIIYRVYYQETFKGFFKTHKWIGIIIASLVFGLSHIINGSLVQVAFTFGIGLIFGFAKEYIKDLHYPGISLTHGLYDFLLYVVTLTLV